MINRNAKKKVRSNIVGIFRRKKIASNRFLYFISIRTHMKDDVVNFAFFRNSFPFLRNALKTGETCSERTLLSASTPFPTDILEPCFSNGAPPKRTWLETTLGAPLKICRVKTDCLHSLHTPWFSVLLGCYCQRCFWNIVCKMKESRHAVSIVPAQGFHAPFWVHMHPFGYICLSEGVHLRLSREGKKYVYTSFISKYLYI